MMVMITRHWSPLPLESSLGNGEAMTGKQITTIQPYVHDSGENPGVKLQRMWQRSRERWGWLYPKEYIRA